MNKDKLTSVEEVKEDPRQPTEKSRVLLAKRDFALHCMLISRQEGCSTTEAKFIAYDEGKANLKDRLA